MNGAPPIVANTDFQQWQSWAPVTTPGGDRTYYVVPGYNGQYVFDPYESDATGSIMIYRNPQPVYERAEQERKQQEEANSLTAQLAPVAGTAVGAIGAGYIADQVANWGSGAAAATGSQAAPSIVGAVRTGATPAAAAGTQAASASAAEGSGILGNVGSVGKYLPYLGAAVGAYGLYDLFDNADYKGDYGSRALQGAASGAAIGNVLPGVGTIIGAGVGAALGLIAGFAGSGKSRDQVGRDQWRKSMQENGLLDDEFKFTLADGKKFDLGVDGNGWTYKGRDGKTYKAQFEVDFSDPRRGYAAGAVNPLMDIITDGAYSRGEISVSATPAASFINMLAQDAPDVSYVNQNARNLYDQLGFNQESMFTAINELAASGKITQDEQRAYHNAVNVAYGEEFGTGKKIDQSNVPNFQEMTALVDNNIGEDGNLNEQAMQEIAARQPFIVEREEVQQQAPQNTRPVQDDQAERLAAMMDDRVPLGEQRQPLRYR